VIEELSPVKKDKKFENIPTKIPFKKGSEPPLYFSERIET